MKKLVLTAAGVTIALIGFIAILYFLPAKCGGSSCGKHEECCEKESKGHSCEGKGPGCEGKEHQTCKEWKDADGKMHKEVRIEIRDGGDMQGSCGGHGEMRGGCGKMNMQMHGCCCCCMMMMQNGMGQGMMPKDSMALDTSVRVKIREKL